ncbi:putative PTS IIA-like nitrogen-regulatory protein PtsN [Coriobacterium glomerans PW2]|uniref:Ascorbate-specific PTS system EIIA component n=1 Tax=Coriobacterium glomerans (strain ATCC 49209 / DSM 20642 / JCM 10262 / PW2) TaxID=700015 RepID=F2N7C3_CORGP|nr:PTS sugar transporter subunit IIA [Coriobacterium glomerans]AEB06598.1 putative PTS IIA-like nitrogen-regulatory protein PtsN [Coriobacterium glomerans PW2]
MLLKEIYDRGHYAFTAGPLSWREAIRACCAPLMADGTIEPIYAEEIIACVEKHGPYIVLIPGVAMPHSTENATGCNATAIGFMRCSEPVSFEQGNPERDAQIFFTLCDTDQETHFANMAKLYSILTDDAVVAKLKLATRAQDLLEIDKLVQGG